MEATGRGTARVLGLDYGSKTVGVAVTDPAGMGAQGVETIFRDKENHLRATLRRISELAAQFDVREIAVGYPLNMDGSEGERAEKAKAFASQVEARTGLPVVLVDERLTTVEADELLALHGVKAKDRKKDIDRIAAMIILEEYLAGKNRADEGPAIKTENE